MALLQKRYQDRQKIKPQRIKFLPPGPTTVPISQLQDIPFYLFYQCLCSAVLSQFSHAFGGQEQGKG